MANSLLDLAIPGAISLYDLYNKKNAVGDATNQGVAGYTAAQDRLQSGADSSLATLLDVYNQSKKSLSPYYDFGLQGLQGYNNLMENPSSVTSNPGYQFRFDQGQQALERSAAAKGGLLSGNTGTALAQYGQNYAMDEYDRALARELPRIQTGTGATNTLANLGESYSRGVSGVYTGLGEGLANLESRIGETKAGGTIGEASSTSGVLSDLSKLYQLWSGGTAAGAAGSAAGGLLSGLTNAGGGSAGAAAALTAKETLGGTGSWADLSAGPRQAGSTVGSVPTQPLSTLTGGASAAAGELPAWYTAGATPAETFGVPAGTTTGIGGSATSGAANANSLLTNPTAGGGSVAALFGPVAMIGIGKMIDSLRGGSIESAKSGKLSAQLQKDMQTDPTGQTAYNTMEKLVTNKLWPNEGNQWVVRDLIKDGTLPLTMPALYGSGSVYNPFSITSPMEEGGLGSFAKSANLNPQQTATLTTTWNAYTAARNKAEYAANGDSGSGAALAQAKADAAKAKYEALVKSYEPQRKANAQNIYTQLRGSGYTGDLSKLETYLGIK